MRRSMHRRSRRTAAAFFATAMFLAQVVVPAAGATILAADDTLPGVPITASPIAGALTEFSDQADVYSTAELHPGDIIEVSLTGSESTQFELGVLGPAATSIDDGGTWDSVEAGSYPVAVRTSVTTTGTHYIVARSWSQSGPYELTWRVAELADQRPRLEADPATVTVTMYLDQTRLTPQAVAITPIDEPVGWSWGDAMSGPPEATSDVSWASLDYFAGEADGWTSTLHVSARPSSVAGTYVGHITAPSGDTRVADATIAVVVNVVAKKRATVHMHASIPSGYTEGHSIKVTGSLHNSSGHDVGGTVSVQRLAEVESADPLWTTVKTAKLSRGVYSAYVAVDGAQTMRVVYDGSSKYRRVASASKLVRQRVVLSKPTIGLSLTWLSRSGNYTLHGHCSPTHFDSYSMDPEYPSEPEATIRVQVQRYYRGAWRTTQSGTMTESDGLWQATYTPGNGMRGRIRAYDVCGEHDRAYSAWKYFYIF